MAFLLVIGLLAFVALIAAALWEAAGNALLGPEQVPFDPAEPTDFRRHPLGDPRLRAWADRRGRAPELYR